jgi:hypothetical protein
MKHQLVVAMMLAVHLISKAVKDEFKARLEASTRPGPPHARTAKRRYAAVDLFFFVASNK